MTKAKITKLDKEIQEGLYDPKMSKQKQFEKQCKAKAHEGKKLKGQQKLTSAVSTSKRLSEFGYDPAPVNYIKLEHGDMLMKDGLIVQKTLPGFETTGLKQKYKIYGSVSNPADVMRLIVNMEDYDREHAKVLHLDTKSNVVGIETIAIGSLNSAIVHPREVFKKAVLDNSASIIFVHNHPSGDPTPSKEDKNLTEKLQKTGGIIGITLLDSVIVGRSSYYSFKESGAMIPDAKLFDIKGIADSLRRQGIEPDLVDIAAEYDHSQSHSWNLKHIKNMLGIGGRRKQGDYEKMAEEFYKAQTIGSRQGWLAHASPQERAAAFARMRETGTLRGYDPVKKKFVVIWGKGERKTFDKLTDAAKYTKHLIKLGNTDAYFTHEETGTLRGYDTRPRGGKYPWEMTQKEYVDFRTKHEGGFDFEFPVFHKSYVEQAIKEKKKIPKIVLDDYPDLRGYDPKPSVPPQRWYEAMVRGIKKSSDVRNPYAIVKNIWTKLSPGKRAEIKAREKKGEQFKYDLPLPDDRPTQGTGTLRMVKPFKLAEVQVNLRVKDYLSALKSGIFSKMKRQDGTTALVARCKSPVKNVNIFVDKAGT